MEASRLGNRCRDYSDAAVPPRRFFLGAPPTLQATFSVSAIASARALRNDRALKVLGQRCCALRHREARDSVRSSGFARMILSIQAVHSRIAVFVVLTRFGDAPEVDDITDAVVFGGSWSNVMGFT